MKKSIMDTITFEDLQAIRKYQIAKCCDFRINLEDTPAALKSYIKNKEKTIEFFHLLCLSYTGERHIFGGEGKTLCGYKVTIFIGTRDHGYAWYCEDCLNANV